MSQPELISKVCIIGAESVLKDAALANPRTPLQIYSFTIKLPYHTMDRPSIGVNEITLEDGPTPSAYLQSEAVLVTVFPAWEP